MFRYVVFLHSAKPEGSKLFLQRRTLNMDMTYGPKFDYGSVDEQPMLGVFTRKV